MALANDPEPVASLRFSPSTDGFIDPDGDDNEGDKLDLGEEEDNDTSLPFPISYVRIVQTPQGSTRRERVSTEDNGSQEKEEMSLEVVKSK